MLDRDDLRDGAERRYPSHLDTILDPRDGAWWAEKYGMALPPETFYRDRERRDAQRRRSVWEVRVKQCRALPEPRDLRPWLRMRRDERRRGWAPAWADDPFVVQWRGTRAGSWWLRPEASRPEANRPKANRPDEDRPDLVPSTAHPLGLSRYRATARAGTTPRSNAEIASVP